MITRILLGGLKFDSRKHRKQVMLILNGNDAVTNRGHQIGWYFMRWKQVHAGSEFFTPSKTTPIKGHFKGQVVGGFNPFEKYARQIGSSAQESGWK